MDVAACHDDLEDRPDAVLVLVAEADDVAEVEAVDQEGDAREHGLVGIGRIRQRVQDLAANGDVVLDYRGDDADRVHVRGCLFVSHANRRSQARRTEPRACNGSCSGPPTGRPWRAALDLKLTSDVGIKVSVA